MERCSFLLLSGLLALGLLAATPVAAKEHATVAPVITFFVAPGGNDAWSGQLPQANGDRSDGPLASLPGARDAVRRLKAKAPINDPVRVVIAGGRYELKETLLFTSEDGGGEKSPIVYEAAAGATPIISGGKPVVDWTVDVNGRWKAPVPIDNFRQLYVNGVRAIRARGASPTGLEIFGKDGYKTTAVDMANWKNPSDLEFCYQVVWAHTRCKVQNIKLEGSRAIITMQQPWFTLALTKAGVNIRKPDSCYLENALELLNEPGEWYLDRAARTVYYHPRPGEDMTKAEVFAPALEKLIELRGTLDRPVQHIQFKGITFQQGSWLRPSQIGHCDVQANFITDSQRKDSLVRDGGYRNADNENLKSPANVVCHAAKSIRFDHCTFTQLGGAGLDIEFGSQDNVVSGCDFHDISGTAVQVGDVLKDDHHPDDPRKIVKNNTIVNCLIHDCCVDYMDGVGVFAGYTEGTIIAHNEIFRLPYSGVSVGWGWGEQDAGGGAYHQPFRYDTPTPAKNNRVEFNNIHEVMGRFDDGAGIYTLGNMSGTVIRGNYIHDCKNPQSSRGWASGIYLDEGSGFIEITGNSVCNVPIPMTYNNRSQDRIKTCREHDNFFNVQPPPRQIVEKAGIRK